MDTKGLAGLLRSIRPLLDPSSVGRTTATLLPVSSQTNRGSGSVMFMILNGLRLGCPAVGRLLGNESNYGACCKGPCRVANVRRRGPVAAPGLQPVGLAQLSLRGGGSERRRPRCRSHRRRGVPVAARSPPSLDRFVSHARAGLFGGHFRGCAGRRRSAVRRWTPRAGHGAFDAGHPFGQGVQDAAHFGHIAAQLGARRG